MNADGCHAKIWSLTKKTDVGFLPYFGLPQLTRLKCGSFAADAQPISGQPIWPPRVGRPRVWAGHGHAATKHTLVFLNMQIVIWNLQ
jgi:hypothetical protein